jgi:hypothetical protein
MSSVARLVRGGISPLDEKVIRSLDERYGVSSRAMSFWLAFWIPRALREWRKGGLIADWLRREKVAGVATTIPAVSASRAGGAATAALSRCYSRWPSPPAPGSKAVSSGGGPPSGAGGSLKMKVCHSSLSRA